ncbi:hypothetical protein GOV12_01675 [Candidatus Pacearchaeota archaeon]|nr:hypothetical protein [Candidatus Pacearchaeota archaeon]
MIKNRISDWINEIRKIPDYSKKFHYKDNKVSDQKMLRESGLPVMDNLCFSMESIDIGKLKEFFRRYSGVFLRVIPSDIGFSIGLKKRYVYGNYDMEFYLDYINMVMKENKNYSKVEFQEWEEDIYGWILISNGFKVICEIGSDLDKLAHDNLIPLSSMVCEIDYARRIFYNWLKKDNLSFRYLEKALEYIIREDGKGFLKGYFEGTVCKSGRVVFFDFKENSVYWVGI